MRSVRGLRARDESQERERERKKLFQLAALLTMTTTTRTKTKNSRSCFPHHTTHTNQCKRERDKRDEGVDGKQAAFITHTHTHTANEKGLSKNNRINTHIQWTCKRFSGVGRGMRDVDRVQSRSKCKGTQPFTADSFFFVLLVCLSVNKYGEWRSSRVSSKKTTKQTNRHTHKKKKTNKKYCESHRSSSQPVTKQPNCSAANSTSAVLFDKLLLFSSFL